MDAPELDKGLRLLRAVTIALMGAMILGICAIVALLFMGLPDRIVEVPDLDLMGAEASAFTRGPDWFAVTTTDGRILIYDADGALRQEVVVDGTASPVRTGDL